MANVHTLRKYFQLKDGECILTRNHFLSLSEEIGMSTGELEIIFSALDTDENGVITLDELMGHWDASGREGNEATPTNSPVESESDYDNSCVGAMDDSFGPLYSPSPAAPNILYEHTNGYRDQNGYYTHASMNGLADDPQTYLKCVPKSNDVGSPCRMYSKEDYEIQAVSSNPYVSRPTKDSDASGSDTERELTPTQDVTNSMSNSNFHPHNNVMDQNNLNCSIPYSHINGDSVSVLKVKPNTEDISHHPKYIHSCTVDINSVAKFDHIINDSSNHHIINDSSNRANNDKTLNGCHNIWNNAKDNIKKPQDQNKTVHVISKPHNTNESTNHIPHHLQRRNSIRVLKSEIKVTDSNQEIRSPVKFELKPAHRKRNDNTNNAPSPFSNEVRFEYDSSKLSVSKDSPRIKKLRKKSPRPESVFSKKAAYLNRSYSTSMPMDLESLSQKSQEQVCELYQNLHSSSNPELVAQFENILLNVIKDVRQYKMENERLEQTYKKEKDEHDRHLRHMEEEMEQQVQNLEYRVRKQEKEKLESEKLDLRIQLDSEITMLQQNLKKLQQDGNNKMDKEQEEHLLSMKKRLEDTSIQNRSLKSELTDAQTNLALVKTEMTSVKQQLDEKTYELDAENKAVEAYHMEQENLRRQLQLLHEANKNLLDTNDNLREMLDTPTNGHVAYKRTTSTDIDLVTLYKSGASARSASPNLPLRKGSVMSDYVDAMSPGNRPLLQASFQDEVGMLPQFMAMSHRFESCEEDSIAEELGDGHILLSPDSGHSTLRDLNEVNDDIECDSNSAQSDLKRGRRHRRVKSSLRVPVEEEDESHDEMESDGEGIMSPDSDGFRKNSPSHRRSPSGGSRSSNMSSRSLTREESLLSQTSRSSRGSTRRQLPAVPRTLNLNTVRVTKEPDRVYKIVLAGDAAVGKSSFIVRLCKGKFVPNLSSTLGVDFQTKMLDVDGHATALQLWDTAGQERFRSVARTYFRRADGVLLLYDVTYERSFLNIREWIDAIEENSVKKIPIMLIGNKTDARLELEQQGRRVVKYEDGLRLSKEINSHFIESSAKDGCNIQEAVIELTRTLRTNEDLEVQTVGLQLENIKDKKDGSCCRKS